MASSKIHHSKIPTFEELPAVKGMPQGCAWSLFDVDGVRDQVGTLNYLTPDVVLEAKNEITEGVSVALNWPMHNCTHAGFGRKTLEHKIFELKPFTAYDDELAVNTQAGSQWDSLKHWGHKHTRLYYNGLKHNDVPTSLDNGIHHWSDRGGIVGRAVLLDYVAHAKRNAIAYSPWSRHEITVADLEAMIDYEKVRLKPADILIVRSGWVKMHDESNDDTRNEKVKNNHFFAGLQGSEETIKWLWNHKFSAVAGDSITFEAWPPSPEWAIHDYSLCFWGQPIGELWNLERLAEKCEQENRWSFFFTSAPLNVIGGVGTPPNALAIF